MSTKSHNSSTNSLHQAVAPSPSSKARLDGAPKSPSSKPRLDGAPKFPLGGSACSGSSGWGLFLVIAILLVIVVPTSIPIGGIMKSQVSRGPANTSINPPLGPSTFRTHVYPVLKDLAAGACAATISKTIVAPIERVKLLLQTQSVNKEIYSGNVMPYTGALNCFVRIVCGMGQRARADCSAQEQKRTGGESTARVQRLNRGMFRAAKSMSG